jgi:hypothetical protein
MKKNVHNIAQVITDEEGRSENSSSDELTAEMIEQEENEQIIRFEEDLASSAE